MPNILDMFPSKFLKEPDLAAPMALTIARVTEEKVGDDLKPVLRFRETGKMLSLNKTNAKILARLHGADYTKWPGKVIEAYWNPDVTYGEDTTGGVRLRETRSAPFNGGNGFTQWEWPHAQREAAAVGITKEEIVAEIRKVGGQGWNQARDTAIVQAMIQAKKGPAETSFDDAPPPPTDGDIPF